MSHVTTDTFGAPPRTVRPRARKAKRLPVVAVAGSLMLTENGELTSSLELHKHLPHWQSTLFVRQQSAAFVAELDAHFTHNKQWQWRATSAERDIVRPDGTRVATRVSTVVHYFGFKNGNYHRIIDPVVMYGHRLDTIWPGEEDAIYRLLQWGIALRNFCHKNNIEVKPTMGGISSQFLTHPRFYPKRRRKVPMAINERSREALPGNHYLLTVAPAANTQFRALYLDQHRAHHYHARVTALPDSNQLYAHGRFVDLAEPVFKSTWEGFYGLYCLSLEAPTRYRRSHWVTKLDRAFVFSNELPHLLDLGYKVNGVYAAWGSFKRDTGMTRYAKWAYKQLDHYGDQKWLKPLLLSTYGTLAIRPKYAETIFKQARSGVPATLLAGKDHDLTGKLVRASKKLEPGFANVIHRGMIEAATRSESIGFGQHLTTQGYRVLSIYADAVIIADDPDKPLPDLMFEPWRCKATLNHLQFINQQAFISGEMTKLPGVSRELMAYRQHAPGHAPRRIKYEAITGRKVTTNRRI